MTVIDSKLASNSAETKAVVWVERLARVIALVPLGIVATTPPRRNSCATTGDRLLDNISSIEGRPDPGVVSCEVVRTAEPLFVVAG